MRPVPEGIAGISRYFGARQVAFYGSGTAALAAAILATIRRRGIARPEVLLPAYGCPSLVAATVYAGAKPVLVDIERRCTNLDLDTLPGKISPHTVAVVAVDLFGIPERVEEIRTSCRESGIYVLEDSAQGFAAGEADELWDGDLVTLSFGRGKPVSLLEGGAVIVNNPELGEALPLPADTPIRRLTNRRTYTLKATLYNRFIDRRLYWMLEKLPFLGLGETSYTALKGIPPMPRQALMRLDSNIGAYLRRSTSPQRQLEQMLLGLRSPNLLDMASHGAGPRAPRLLRYPVLTATKELRDLLLRSLRRAGLGATCLYGHALPFVSGLHELLHSQRNVPHAVSLADRLLTLPTHTQVTEKQVDHMRQIFENCLSEIA